MATVRKRRGERLFFGSACIFFKSAVCAVGTVAPEAEKLAQLSSRGRIRGEDAVRMLIKPNANWKSREEKGEMKTAAAVQP